MVAGSSILVMMDNPVEAVNAACREEHDTWKNRPLNPVNTIHLFILQVLNQNTPVNDLPHSAAEPQPKDGAGPRIEHGLNTDKICGFHHGPARWITRGCNPRARHGIACQIVSGVQDSRSS